MGRRERTNLALRPLPVLREIEKLSSIAKNVKNETIRIPESFKKNLLHYGNHSNHAILSAKKKNMT